MEYRVVIAEFDDALARLLRGRDALRVLDAGAGSDTGVELPPTAHVVGIDLSESALAENPALDERIVGDLETVELAPKSFDLIVCRDVLEHLSRPELALQRFAGALADDGLLALGLPNVLSVKGLATKCTPYSFHRWAYRRAALSRGEPHRTFLRFSIAPRALRRWAADAGLTLEFEGFFEAPIQVRLRQALRLTGRRWTAASSLVRALSLRSVATDDTDYVVIFSKRSTAPAPAPARS